MLPAWRNCLPVWLSGSSSQFLQRHTSLCSGWPSSRTAWAQYDSSQVVGYWEAEQIFALPTIQPADIPTLPHSPLHLAPHLQAFSDRDAEIHNYSSGHRASTRKNSKVTLISFTCPINAFQTYLFHMGWMNSTEAIYALLNSDVTGSNMFPSNLLAYHAYYPQLWGLSAIP